MAVRNFWVDAYIDGRKTKLSGGPMSKQGGMRIDILQRSEGEIVTAFVVDCYVEDGELFAEVANGSREVIAEFSTKR